MFFNQVGQFIIVYSVSDCFGYKLNVAAENSASKSCCL